MTGFCHVRPPSVERLVRTAAPDTESSIASVEIIQTSCSGSYATAGSLIRAHGPAGVAKIVVAGSMPVVHVRPAFVVVAQPMLLEPPSKKRPVWNVATTVLPQPKESGSSCVRCWLVGFVYGSELIGVATTLPA